jgi:hypothetical protein
VAPFWDDLFIYPNTHQGLYYEVDGTAPQRTVTFEWYTSHFGSGTEYYHFTTQFSEAEPGAWTTTYYQVSDSGSSATVGTQGGPGESLLSFIPLPNSRLRVLFADIALC